MHTKPPSLLTVYKSVLLFETSITKGVSKISPATPIIKDINVSKVEAALCSMNAIMLNVITRLNKTCRPCAFVVKYCDLPQ